MIGKELLVSSFIVNAAYSLQSKNFKIALKTDNETDMFADLSHPNSASLTDRVTLSLGRLWHAFVTKDSARLPAELAQLSDHQLCDIGVDPRRVRRPDQEVAASLQLLQREWP